MKRFTTLLALAIAAIMTIGAAVIAYPADSTADSYLPVIRAEKNVKYIQAKGNWSVGAANGFQRFPLYSVGDNFEDLPLVAVNSNLGPEEPGERVRRDDVDFIYGACRSVNGSGCVPPLEVQIWNACERHKESYDRGPDGFGPDQTLVVRGVDAALFEEGTRLELYTEGATIVIFGRSRAHVMRAAAALRGVNGALPPAAKLPTPRGGTSEGSAPCQG